MTKKKTKYTLEEVRKMKAKPKKTLSIETKRKISLAQKYRLGISNVAIKKTIDALNSYDEKTDEDIISIDNIIKKRSGKKKSRGMPIEHRNKIRDRLLGRKRTPIQIHNITQAQRARRDPNYIREEFVETGEIVTIDIDNIFDQYDDNGEVIVR